MKKIVSCLLVAMLALPMFAQEAAVAEKSDYLPQAGDFAIGFNLNPFTNYIGKLFNGSTNASIDNEAIGGSGLLWNKDLSSVASPFPLVSIQGKYMITDQLGVRANIGLLLNRTHEREYVLDDAALAADPLSREKVIDSYKFARTGGSLSAGVEYRVGQRRVQGVFSGSALYAFYTQSKKYEYGNSITEVNQKPESASWTSWEAISTAMPNARKLKDYNNDGTHTIGLAGSIGVECFVAPKIALGAEVNLALLYTWTPNKYVEYEGYNTLNGQVENFTDLKAPKTGDFVFGTQNIGANLYMTFYFGKN